MKKGRNGGGREEDSDRSDHNKGRGRKIIG